MAMAMGGMPALFAVDTRSYIYARAGSISRDQCIAYRRCTYVGRVYKIFSDVIECTSHDQRNKIRCP